MKRLKQIICWITGHNWQYSAGTEALCPSIRGRHDRGRCLRTFDGSFGLVEQT
jgi:hypothetical protein